MTLSSNKQNPTYPLEEKTVQNIFTIHPNIIEISEEIIHSIHIYPIVFGIVRNDERKAN